MMLHNFKSAIRSMGRNKLFSGINVVGLAIGITSSLLILAWVQYEYSYNTWKISITGHCVSNARCYVDHRLHPNISRGECQPCNGIEKRIEDGKKL